MRQRQKLAWEKRLDEKGPRIARKSLRCGRMLRQKMMRSGSRKAEQKRQGEGQKRESKMRQPDRSRRFRRLWEIMTRGTKWYGAGLGGIHERYAGE
jgi:hypothetical protein